MAKKCPTCGRRLSHESPGRIKEYAGLRAEIDAELAKALTEEEATAQGYRPIQNGRNFPIRLWDNCIKAIRSREAWNGILVWQRDRKDVQVWVKPMEGAS